MIKDIVFPEVEDVAVAVVQQHEGLDEYDVYLINMKFADIKNVLVVSNGYGDIDNRHLKTSTLRHFVEEVKQHSFVKIEPIQKEVFGLSNEYWVSFTLNGQMFDKQFIFLPETIIESNFTQVPLIHKKGVLIR
ncbi:MAG: hypothetical protein JST26_11540 [Bacteroidetes bacterium]|nr:hypothetical protein [Bacteroidota bacterium]